MSEGEPDYESLFPELNEQTKAVLEVVKALGTAYDYRHQILTRDIKRLNYALGRSTNMLMLALAMKSTTDPERRAEMMKEIDAHLDAVQEIQSKIGFVSE
ncbi:hypothetical protein DSD19_17715 [Rhodovulum sp. BSW8]|uniref:hypothetical protein n=1 Tax=Rhodovulum sp. BSW8 TaxID=2259645 RepID=UPI000DE37566|nr:hypothetical protein [Rhodovulum sp. BSW8]RBO51933.1 hypothetical protein DSD19_17715 [Rhodovulum sp. BSW8]